MTEKENIFLKPRVDCIFKRLFGDERNKEILESFLEAVLNLNKNETAEIRILNPELTKENEQDKESRLDILVRTKLRKSNKYRNPTIK